MSSTELKVALTDGELNTAIEYRNSWGGAAMVWTALALKYGLDFYDDFRDKKRPPMGEDSGWEQVWKRHADGGKMRPWEVNVLCFTYDNCLIQGCDLKVFADSLDLFQEALQQPDTVCHLKAMATEVRKAIKEGARAVGLYATSVSEDPWVTYDDHGLNEDHDDYDPECVPYNIDRGDKHYFAKIHALSDEWTQDPTTPTKPLDGGGE